MAAVFWPQAVRAQDDLRVVINEIHYNPHIPTELVEFVELYNRTDASVNLSGWQLAGAVTYTFPANTILGPYQFAVVAQNPDQLRAKFGFDGALGPYSGKLANEGEELILRSDVGPRVDAVDYGAEFPWPIVGIEPGHSIQLVNPHESNDLAGSWRAARPSPGARNRNYAENAPPQIEAVAHWPQSPTAQDAVTITADVRDRDGVAAVTLAYQIVAPGNYIPINSPAYDEGWQILTMQKGDDGLYAVTLPATLQQHRHLVRYRIAARDNAGQTVQTPYPEDDQPNFAYFVYDGVPEWRGSIDGGPNGMATFDFTRMRTLPVYHLIARQSDVADAQFLPNTPRASGYEGNDYLWYGTLVYDGDVYDHVGFRARGGFTRYATGKNMWKINFYRGHRLEARDNYDRPYDIAWDKLNLSAVIQQSHRGYRGEQGMFESMSFRLFNLAGVEAPLSHFIHFRIIDDAQETGGDQYTGDFWGLYLAIEQMDGRFLEQHDLPNGNLYKIEGDATERNNHSPAGVGEWNDLAYFINKTLTDPAADWWRDYLDMDRYYAYRAIVEAVHHYDINQNKNYFYYFNPESRKWSVHPWDVDLTWADDFPGDGVEPISASVFARPELNLEFQNTLRTVRDLLFNEEQMDWMLFEHAALINSPADGLAMVDADRSLWDYHPVYGTRYVDEARTAPGRFYAATPTRDFSGMVQLMRWWVISRSQWIDATLLTDRDFPATPQVSYTGEPRFPVDALRFRTSPFADPQGADTFGALQWRIAEVTEPNAPAYSATAPILYEINAVYESPHLTEFSADFTPPPGVVKPGHAYRVRARMQDNSGRWSHWSAPVTFVARSAQSAAEEGLRISEIMYHPLPLGEIEDDRLEFVELTNAGRTRLYLGHTQLSDAIDYTFAEGLYLEPGEYVVLASDRDAFFDRYGFRPFDEYDRNLSNSGERLTLTDAYARVLAQIDFADEAPWPVRADGAGPSLVINQPMDEPSRPESWRASLLEHGSPGAADPLPIVISEIQPRTAQFGAASVELFNPTDYPADISYWRLDDDRTATPPLYFMAGAVIPPQGYRVFSADSFGEQATTMLRYPRTGGTLMLNSADRTQRATGYATQIAFQGFDGDLAYGRHVTSDGRSFFVPQAEPTLGRANRGPLPSALVISEIMYQPVSGEEFVEITNVSNSPIKLYDAARPEHTWRLDGALFSFPTGLEVPAGGKLLVVSDDPTQVCVDYALAPDVQVVGPFGRLLSDEGDALALMRPLTPDNDSIAPYMPEDVVVYDDAVPWPTDAAGQGASLERMTQDAFGSEPNNWRARYAGGFARLANSGPSVQLCSFNAAYDEAEDIVAIEWVSSAESNVARFNLWRGPRDGSDALQLLTPDGIPAAGGEARTRYNFTDALPDPADPARTATIYRLEAVGRAGEEVEVGYTAPLTVYRQTYLPVVGR